LNGSHRSGARPFHHHHEVARRDDQTLLAWAGKNGRVVLTHDLATMVPAFQLQGQPLSLNVAFGRTKPLILFVNC
jgi:hypothetical protein